MIKRNKIGAFLIYILGAVIFFVGCKQGKNLSVDVEEIEDNFSSATYVTKDIVKGKQVIATWKSDAEYEKADAIFSWIFNEKQQWFAFGSRGNEAEDYFNRYEGYVSWIDGSSILQLQLYRNSKKEPTIELTYLEEALESQEGVVGKVDERSFRILQTTEGEDYQIFWDYPRNKHLHKEFRGIDRRQAD